MTDHEMLLMRAAVEACRARELSFSLWHSFPGPHGKWTADATSRDGLSKMGMAPTIADAITALLRDLGADVPEWPSEERVAEIREELTLNGADDIGRAVVAFGDLKGLPLPELLALWGDS